MVFPAAARLTRLFWPLLKAAQGHVVNIVGGAARSPEPEFLVGGSVNAAVANFSKGLSKLGMRDGVNVNVIHPGNTATERQEELLAQRAAAPSRPSSTSQTMSNGSWASANARSTRFFAAAFTS